jgi:hypothetical protein
MEMQETIGAALAQGFTGQAEVAFALGDRAELLIQGGQVRTILWTEKTRKKRLAGDGWADLFASPQMGVITLHPAPGRFLNIQQACFDILPQEEKFKLPNAELENLFASQAGHESATVFMLQWNSSRGCVLVSGSNLRLQRAVFLSGTQFESDDAALSSMLYWRDPTCEVKIYKHGLEDPYWSMLHLNVLFEYMAAQLLTQYGYLTGKVMVSSMVRNVIYAAAQMSCEMLNISGRLQDHTLFSTVEGASLAYKDILALMEQQMVSVLGSNFLAVAKAQALEELNPFYTSLARMYGFLV